MSVWKYVCMHVYVSVCMCVHAFLCVHLCVYACVKPGGWYQVSSFVVVQFYFTFWEHLSLNKDLAIVASRDVIFLFFCLFVSAEHTALSGFWCGSSYNIPSSTLKIILFCPNLYPSITSPWCLEWSRFSTLGMCGHRFQSREKLTV